MFLNNSENMSNIGGKKQQRWRDFGKMIIKYKSLTPSKADMMRRGPPEIPCSFEVSKEESQVSYTLSIKEEPRNWWQGRHNFSSSLGQSPRFQCIPKNPDNGRCGCGCTGAAVMHWTGAGKGGYTQPEEPMSRELRVHQLVWCPALKARKLLGHLPPPRMALRRGLRAWPIWMLTQHSSEQAWPGVLLEENARSTRSKWLIKLKFQDLRRQRRNKSVCGDRSKDTYECTVWNSKRQTKHRPNGNRLWNNQREWFSRLWYNQTMK